MGLGRTTPGRAGFSGLACVYTMAYRIAVIGVGGVGGYFGGKLCRLIPDLAAEVYFIARGTHLEAIRQRGLLVETRAEGKWICHPTLVTDDFCALPRIDLCLVCVKSYDLAGVSRALKHSLAENTTIIPLLNGVDICERMRRELPEARIYPGCTYIGARLESPGRVKQVAGDCSIQFGPDPFRPMAKPLAACEAFSRSGIPFDWFEDILPELWRKFLFIASLGIVQAGFDRSLGQVMESPKMTYYLRSIMSEIADLARRSGVHLPADIIESNCRRAQSFAFDTRTSFQRDFERPDRPDERDVLTGTILRLGNRLGVDTPVTRELAALLERKKPWPALSS